MTRNRQEKFGQDLVYLAFYSFLAAFPVPDSSKVCGAPVTLPQSTMGSAKSSNRLNQVLFPSDWDHSYTGLKAAENHRLNNLCTEK
jgi:hypothetical protein